MKTQFLVKVTLPKYTSAERMAGYIKEAIMYWEPPDFNPDTLTVQVVKTPKNQGVKFNKKGDK